MIKFGISYDVLTTHRFLSIMLIGYIRKDHANTIIHFIDLINDGKSLIVLKFMIIKKLLFKSK